MRFPLFNTVLIGLVGSVLGAVLGQSAGYPEGPPAAHTGGFGEPTCQECHFDQPLNDPGGLLTLDGLPDAYVSGERYLLTVQLARPELHLGGFEVSARFSEGTQSGRQAGTLASLDDRTAVDDSSTVQYAHHTRAGTVPAATDTARWIIAWTAPEIAGAPVVFHIAANAANDDASEFGDFIYAGQWMSDVAGVER